RRHEGRLAWPLPVAEKLTPDFTRQHFRHQRRHRVAEHPLDVGPAAFKYETVRECLEPAHLLTGQLSIAPMERTDGRPRLRLNGPGGLFFCKLQEKAQISGPPPKKLRATAAIRVPKVILPFRDGRKQIAPFPANSKGWLVRQAWQIANRIPSR